jgi:adenylate cyclase
MTAFAKVVGWAAVLSMLGQTVLAEATTSPSQQLSPFLVVFIDSRTEASLGPFPYDRSVLANAVEMAAKLQARAVVLKFFLDQPKSEKGDLALAEAMKHIPVVLEACLKNDEQFPNPLPERFFVSGLGADTQSISGKSGWLPIPAFAAGAVDVGFVDIRTTDAIPTFEEYGGRPVKSLATCCLELAVGGHAKIIPGKLFTIEGRSASLDAYSQVHIELPTRDNLEYVPFLDFIRGGVAANYIKDRVVIIGYDGQGMPTVSTPVGKLKLHRAFCFGLIAAYWKLESSASTASPRP